MPFKILHEAIFKMDTVYLILLEKNFFPPLPTQENLHSYNILLLKRKLPGLPFQNIYNTYMLILVDCFVFLNTLVDILHYIWIFILYILSVQIEMYVIIILIDIQICVRHIRPHLKVNFNPIIAISTIIVHMSTCLCIL